MAATLNIVDPLLDALRALFKAVVSIFADHPLAAAIMTIVAGGLFVFNQHRSDTKDLPSGIRNALFSLAIWLIIVPPFDDILDALSKNIVVVLGDLAFWLVALLFWQIQISDRITLRWKTIICAAFFVVSLNILVPFFDAFENHPKTMLSVAFLLVFTAIWFFWNYKNPKWPSPKLKAYICAGLYAASIVGIVLWSIMASSTGGIGPQVTSPENTPMSEPGMPNPS